MTRRFLLAFVLSASCLGACSSIGAPAAPAAQSVMDSPAAAVDAASLPSLSDYTLGAADKVRILVYNEPNLSGEFLVNSNGMISVPLIGDVTALNRTTTEIRADIETRLSAGYLRAPQVSVDVLTFRPFYILGEVNKPGDYPYSAGLTALKAVATANGFTYRADKKNYYLKHPGQSEEVKHPMSADMMLQPGDTVRIAERYF
ncbi:polysaccharide biosynthesis/export family protein [soil metagenome]